MIRWIPYTFVRTVLFFIGGTLLGFYFPNFLHERVLFILVLFLAGVYTALVLFLPRAPRPFNPGWVALPLVFLLGTFNILSHTESRREAHLLHVNDTITWYRAVVTGFPEERASTWRMEARVTDINDGSWKRSEGRIMLYLAKDAFPVPYQYGDVLVVKGSPRLTGGSGNPGEFDYKAYLALRNIYHQHFVRGGEAIQSGYAPPGRVMAFALKGRQWAEETLHRYVDGEREQAIASALVLGVTDGLDNELLDAYSATGSMHILAVSGLHISIIYLILLRFLSPLNKLKGGRWVVALISLGVLWLYAFVTGLPPSVLRAVTMFSFLAVARPWSRSTNIYNTLAVSAFLLLWFDPFLLFSVGFQLSYIAVLGIVYLYPRILLLWEPENMIAVEIWKLGAVAIAAQIATFPLGLLYFHQFPNYFLLSNLLVVPLSFVVLVLGLLILATSFMSLVAAAVGFCLELVIRFLNGIVFVLEGFPFSRIENVYITPVQCALLFTFIIFILALAEYKRFVYLTAGLVTITLYAAVQWAHFERDVNAQRIAVYKLPGHSAIDLIDRGQAFFLGDSIAADGQQIRFHVQPHRLIRGVGMVRDGRRLAHSFNGCRLLVWGGKKILLIDDKNFALPAHVVVDWIIIGNNAVADLNEVSKGVDCSRVILDSSNSFFFASRFLEAAKFHELEVHSVLHQGAFIQTIETQDS